MRLIVFLVALVFSFSQAQAKNTDAIQLAGLFEAMAGDDVNLPNTEEEQCNPAPDRDLCETCSEGTIHECDLSTHSCVSGNCVPKVQCNGQTCDASHCETCIDNSCTPPANSARCCAGNLCAAGQVCKTKYVAGVLTYYCDSACENDGDCGGGCHRCNGGLCSTACADSTCCGSSCCASGQSCSTDGTCTCNNATKITCGNQCCDKDNQQCNPNSKQCCAKTAEICGQACCGENQECKNGECKPKDKNVSFLMLLALPLLFNRKLKNR